MLRYLLRRPVLITIGAAGYEGLPLRLRDLADLEALAASTWDHPADELRPDLDAAELRALSDRAEAGWPSIAASIVLVMSSRTLAGRAVVLAGVLRLSGVGMDEAARLAGEASEAEWRAVERLAWGVDPMSEVLSAIDRFLGVTKDSRGEFTIAEAVCALATSLRRLPIDLADVTLPEMIYLGEKGKRTDAMVWGSTFDIVADAAREKFYRDTEPATDDPSEITLNGSSGAAV